MKPLDLPGIVAFLKANSEAPNDPADPHMQAIAQIDRMANALVDALDGNEWQDVHARTKHRAAKCMEIVDVCDDALAYLLGK
jgi:hypothetical protein